MFARSVLDSNTLGPANSKKKKHPPWGLKESVGAEVVVSPAEFVESVLVADNHVKVPRDHASVVGDGGRTISY